jgi:hypothetical protein
VFSVSRLSLGIDVVAVPTAIAIILAMFDDGAFDKCPDRSARHHACSSARDRIDADRGSCDGTDSGSGNCARHRARANIGATAIRIVSATAD